MWSGKNVSRIHYFLKANFVGIDCLMGCISEDNSEAPKKCESIITIISPAIIIPRIVCPNLFNFASSNVFMKLKLVPFMGTITTFNQTVYFGLEFSLF